MARSKTDKSADAAPDTDTTAADAAPSAELEQRIAGLEKKLDDVRELAGLAVSDLEARIEALEAKLDAAKGAAVELTDGEAPFVTREELDDRISSAIGRAISFGSKAPSAAPVPPGTPPVIHLHVKDGRKRHSRAGFVFGPDWTELRTAELTRSQLESLLADPILETPEEYEDRLAKAEER